MAPIAGVYHHVKNQNFVEYLIAIGASEDNAKMSDSLKPKLDVKVNGKNISMDNDLGVQKLSVTLVLGEEVDEKLLNNAVLKSLAKLDGNILTVTSKSPDAKISTRMYRFFDTELVVTFSTEGVATIARSFYKRVSEL